MLGTLLYRDPLALFEMDAERRAVLLAVDRRYDLIEILTEGRYGARRRA